MRSSSSRPGTRTSGRRWRPRPYWTSISSRISKETLRRWMMAEGLWLSRRQRRTFHQPRLRRESYGELIQIDGSDHRWFEQRGEPCTLLVFINDATSKLMQLRFVPSESTDSYFAALQGYLQMHGCPDRDPLCELKPGKRPRGASESHAARSAGQGAAYGRHL